MGIIRDHPELAIFLCLALGYLVGKARVGPITLGGICGTLIVSLLLGTRHISVGDDVKTIFFAIFIFALGYRVHSRCSGVPAGGEAKHVVATRSVAAPGPAKPDGVARGGCLG